MKSLNIMVLLWGVLVNLSFPTISKAQPTEFLSWVNDKRAVRLAPKLEYEIKFQDHLNTVAKSLETKYCHCYSGASLGEVITKSTSLEDCFTSLYVSVPHRKIMMMRKARRATVGVWENDGWTYLIMRVYDK